MSGLEEKKSKTNLESNLKNLMSHVEELRHVNEELHKKLRELQLLVQVSSLLSQSLDKNETIESLKRFFLTNFNPEEYCILLQTETDEKLEVISYFGENKIKKIWINLDTPSGVLSRAFSSCEVVYIPLLSSDIQFELYQNKDLPGGSAVILPLSPASERNIGLVVLVRPGNDGFNPAEISQLEQISSHVAAVIDKTILYHTTRELAFTDGLTRIFNRRYFDQRYLREILRARRYQRSLAILMIDIDHFKKYNDTFGHLMGDEVLKKVARELERNIRRADILCRYGGEEFVIVLPEIDMEHASMVAEKLRTAVSRAVIHGEEKMPNKNITISIGVAAFPESGEDGLKLLEKADQALYRAKKNGRNRVESAVPSI